jgi:hypothetical protein
MTSVSTLRRIGSAAALALVLSTASAGAQNAEEQAKIKLAREVIEVSGAAGNLSAIVPIFLDEAKRTFTRTRPELTKDLDDVVKSILPEFETRRDQLLNDIAIVYAANFTDQELNDIRTFYTTPSGKRLVQILPGVLQASYERTNDWSRKMSQDVVTRIRTEMKKKGHEI